MSPNWLFLLLIPIAALVLIMIGPIAVLRLQKRSLRAPREFNSPMASPAIPSPGFQQTPQETREDFVRRHWQRPGVVADGVTLVDLYDRIRALEERAARAEQQPTTPPVD